MNDFYKEPGSKVNKYYIAAIILLAVFLVFTLQNTETLPVYFLTFTFSSSKAFVMFFTFLLGAGTATAFSYIRNLRRKKKENDAEK